MKKTYQQPAINVARIKLGKTIMLITSENSAIQSKGMDGKSRGSRSSDDDFDDLW